MGKLRDDSFPFYCYARTRGQRSERRLSGLLRLSSYSPFNESGATIIPITTKPMISSPIPILKTQVNLAKNSVAKAAATITGKVLRIKRVIKYRFPSDIKFILKEKAINFNSKGFPFCLITGGG